MSDEIIATEDPIVDYHGRDARLSVVLQLDNDQLLYGNSYARIGEDGLLERIAPSRIEAAA